MTSATGKKKKVVKHKPKVLAKKRFTDGLSSLFGEDDQQAPPQELTLFPEEERGTARRDEEKRSSKGFASQLDAFLAEAFEAEAQRQEEAPPEARSRGTKPRLSGLDMLIRQTTDTPPQAGPKTSDKRRLTLAFDKAQLTRLKAIAQQEGIYLKDLINQLIERYLAEHRA